MDSKEDGSPTSVSNNKIQINCRDQNVGNTLEKLEKENFVKLLKSLTKLNNFHTVTGCSQRL